jgi:uncharacterized protein (DUF4415 family)
MAMTERPSPPGSGAQRPFAAALERLRGGADVDPGAQPSAGKAIAGSEMDWSDLEIDAPGKTPISIRLDDDVLAFFKQGGPGYQKRINAVLRAYMQHNRRGRER